MNKIVFIGGGSFAWTPKIMADMLLDPILREQHFVLYDINRPAAELVAAFVNRLKGDLKAPALITATDNRDEAFRDANFFIVTISTGGLDAMAHDLAIPEEYGILHTVGDTSGPGGWARTIRNYKVFVDLAAQFNAYAPHATVLNYTNPMTTLTDVLARHCRAPVVGLCHGAFENLELIKTMYRLESEDDISVVFGGLNHFFWMKELAVKGRNVMDELREQARTRSLTQMSNPDYQDAMGFSSHHELATHLLRETGLLPYIGDRHTCEFFPDYITSADAMKRFNLKRTPITHRRDVLQTRRDKLEKAVAEGIPEHYLTRSRETAVDICRARITGRNFIDVGNVPNRGQMPDLPEGGVVETLVVVNGNGFTPLVAGHFPEPVVGWLRSYDRLFRATVDACEAADREAALAALALDSVCSHLPPARIRELGNRLLTQYARFLPF
ncbi:MAG: hypothetical protein K8T26_08505 [Lentisphaerae bacterium]|nr:hypothetical protein [Lentisphaerota bacterium]